jgi:hypothetical protein
MKAKCVKDFAWYTLNFEAGETYDMEELLYERLIRTPNFVKATKKVEQPEAPKEVKPAVTFDALQNDDLAVVKPLKKKKK